MRAVVTFCGKYHLKPEYKPEYKPCARQLLTKKIITTGVFSDPDYERGFVPNASIASRASWQDFWTRVEQFSLRWEVPALEYGCESSAFPANNKSEYTH